MKRSLVSNRDLYKSLSRPVDKIVKSRKLRWAKRVARMGEIRNGCRSLVGKLTGKRLLKDRQLCDGGYHCADGSVFECPREFLPFTLSTSSVIVRYLREVVAISAAPCK